MPRARNLVVQQGPDVLERVLSHREWRGSEVLKFSDGSVRLNHPSGATCLLYPWAVDEPIEVDHLKGEKAKHAAKEKQRAANTERAAGFLEHAHRRKRPLKRLRSLAR